MWVCRAHEDESPLAALARRGPYDCFFAGVAVLALVHAGESWSAEAASAAAGVGPSPAGELLRFPATGAPAFALPDNYTMPRDSAASFTSEFRARGSSPLHSEHAPTVADESLMSDTTVWQRLADFRALGRVRVLTLWQAGANSVSLQAGKKGSPSLQWTANLFNRGAGSGGLLDRLIPVSSIGERHDVRGAPHPVAPVAPAPQVKSAAAAAAPAHPAGATAQ